MWIPVFSKVGSKVVDVNTCEDRIIWDGELGNSADSCSLELGQREFINNINI